MAVTDRYVAVLSQSLLKYNEPTNRNEMLAVAVLSQSLLKYNRSDKLSTLQIVIAFFIVLNISKQQKLLRFIRHSFNLVIVDTDNV